MLVHPPIPISRPFPAPCPVVSLVIVIVDITTACICKMQSCSWNIFTYTNITRRVDRSASAVATASLSSIITTSIMIILNPTIIFISSTSSITKVNITLTSITYVLKLFQYWTLLIIVNSSALVAPSVVVPINTLPFEFTRSASLPAVSTVNVSAAGNLIAVLSSPVWNLESLFQHR